MQIYGVCSNFKRSSNNSHNLQLQQQIAVLLSVQFLHQHLEMMENLETRLRRISWKETEVGVSQVVRMTSLTQL